MKKYSIIAVISIAILLSFANFFQPFQIAQACYPWDPDWNPITGECGDPVPPSGERPEEGRACWFIMDPNNPRFLGYATDCVWAVAGSCTPENCPFGS